jgi:hypothetical protein
VELRFHSQRFSLAIPEEGEVYVILRFLALAEPMVTSGLPAGSEKDAELDPDDPASLRIVFSASAAGFES